MASVNGVRFSSMASRSSSQEMTPELSMSISWNLSRRCFRFAWDNPSPRAACWALASSRTTGVRSAHRPLKARGATFDIPVETLLLRRPEFEF